MWKVVVVQCIRIAKCIPVQMKWKCSGASSNWIVIKTLYVNYWTHSTNKTAWTTTKNTQNSKLFHLASTHIE